MASEKVRTLYIDHQIIAKETNWPQLLTVLAQHKSLRLVVSIYNLIEISAATDKAKAIKRAEFIDSLHPAWILERFMVEKNEVQNFVYQYYLKKPYTPPSVFADHLSTALSYHLRSRVILGMNARKWLDHFVNPEELKPLKQRTVESLITVQTASARQKKAIEGDLFREWIIQKIPLSDPDGKLFTKEEESGSLR